MLEFLCGFPVPLTETATQLSEHYQFVIAMLIFRRRCLVMQDFFYDASVLEMKHCS
jgi:hypothetical protein